MRHKPHSCVYGLHAVSHVTRGRSKIPYEYVHEYKCKICGKVQEVRGKLTTTK